MRKAGIILSLLGVGIWGLSLFFSTGYRPGLGLLGSLPRMEVLIKPGKAFQYADGSIAESTALYQWEDAAGKVQINNRPPAEGNSPQKLQVYTRDGNSWVRRPDLVRTEMKGRLAVPLRSALAAGFMLILIGIGQIVLGHPKVQ